MITWSERFAVGIKAVDEQHRSLVEKINELREAMRVGEGKDKLASLLRFLGDYAVTHFATEERLMAHHGYSKFDEHKKIHDDFKADFRRLSQELSTSTRASLLSIEVERRLSDWLVQHIQKNDKEAAAYLTQKGAR